MGWTIRSLASTQQIRIYPYVVRRQDMLAKMKEADNTCTPNQINLENLSDNELQDMLTNIHFQIKLEVI